MKPVILIYFLLVLVAITSTSHGNNNYWELDVPVIEGGTNIHSEKLDKFSTIIKSYDISVDSIDIVAKYYNDFFKSKGWENSLNEGMSQNKEMKFDWSTRRMTFNHEGKPEAIYTSTWKTKDIPVKGFLQLTLTNYFKNNFEGNVKVVISPDIDMSPLTKINRLIGQNPKNLFYLYETVKGNPFKIDTVNIPTSFTDTDDKIIAQYYTIVQQIMNNYSNFHNKYVRVNDVKP